MSYNGGEIVELLEENGSWNKTTLRDAIFICNAYKYDEAKYIRFLEGSPDNGVTWKTRYEDDLQRIEKHVDLFLWRVKEK